MKNKAKNKFILNYILIQILSLVILNLIIIFTEYYNKKNQAETFVLSMRNNLIIGDYKTSQLNLSNSSSLGFTHVEVFSSNAQEFILNINNSQANGPTSPFEKKIIIKIGTNVNTNENSFVFYFHYSILNSIKLALVIWIFFIIISSIYFYSEKVKLEKEFQQKLLFDRNETIRQIALQVSHDIRSPLAVINTLKHDLSKNENQKIFTNAINRINTIASNLLESEKKEDFANSFFEIASTSKNFINEKKIETSLNIDFKCEFDHAVVSFSEIEYCRILSNLINNSIESKRLENDILVSVYLYKENDYIKTTLSDNGNGIPKHLLNKIGKEKFSTKSMTNHSGTGLGLSHAYQKIINNNGKFEIKSDVNSGSIITIFLPIHKIQPAQIILLDDDELTRMNWEYKAKKVNINLRVFKNENELRQNLDQINKDSVFYIDSELGSIKGEILAEELFKLGFHQLNLTTGHSKERFIHLPYIKTVIDKSPPF